MKCSEVEVEKLQFTQLMSKIRKTTEFSLEPRSTAKDPCNTAAMEKLPNLEWQTLFFQ